MRQVAEGGTKALSCGPTIRIAWGIWGAALFAQACSGAQPTTVNDGESTVSDPSKSHAADEGTKQGTSKGHPSDKVAGDASASPDGAPSAPMDASEPGEQEDASVSVADAGAPSTDPTPPPTPSPNKPPADGPPAGYAGGCAIPAEADVEDTSHPDHVVGNGTPQSCTGDAFIEAVAKGGVITFNCGPNPVTITVDRPAKVFNDKGPKVVIDGGGLVTLSGGGKTRILYMNTCDSNQVWTTSHCDNQDSPQLTVQNLTFVDGNSRSETQYDGGGAIWVRGGRLKVVNTRFFRNVCAATGIDVGGGAIRVSSQYNGLPVYVVKSTFGGQQDLGNAGSNGGALSSSGVSWSIYNSLLSYNQASGQGGTPPQPNTPGGGSGGAIYNDGDRMTLSLCGVKIEHNQASAFGSAIFFVSNDHTGNIVIRDSTITQNMGGSWYPTYPQISNFEDTPIQVTNSTVQ